MAMSRHIFWCLHWQHECSNLQRRNEAYLQVQTRTLEGPPRMATPAKAAQQKTGTEAAAVAPLQHQAMMYSADNQASNRLKPYTEPSHRWACRP